MVDKFELLRLNRAGQSYSEIGRERGLTRGQVASYIRRAKEEESRGSSPLLSKNRECLSLPESKNVTESVTDEANGNQREIDSKSARITTLDQLVELCKIDLEVWAIERHVVNKWEVGVKDPATGQVIVEPLFQVKAWLAKKSPEAIKPAISPVSVSMGQYSRPAPGKGRLKSALIIPDPQFGFSRDIMRGKLTPFHDRQALDIVLQIAQAIQPDLTVFLGDVMDFSGWSDKYIRSPEFFFTTQPALIEAAWYMAHIRAQTSGEVYYLEGNHDQRPEKQIVTHLVDAYGLRSADHLEAAPVMSIDNLLGLSRMGIRYVDNYPDGEVWLNDALRCVHGDKARSNPGNTAAAVVKESDSSVIFGHCHRKELATKTLPGRHGYRTVMAYSPGCLCHVDGRVPGSSKFNHWQQGAAVVWFDEKTYTIVPVDIDHGSAIYNGGLVSGADYLPSLRADTSWEF